MCPPDPNDDPCDACTKASCCDEVTACFANPDCECVALCIDGGLDEIECFGQCLVNGPPAELGPLGECVTNNCADQCL
jgi:hypothetical protein